MYDGTHVAVEYDGDTGGIRRRFFWGPGADEPILQDEGGAMNCSGTRVLHQDERGSVVAAADCYGVRQAVNTYDESGIPGAGNAAFTAGGRYGYTGQAWLPELGLWFYKNRMYVPWHGRFMQTDPIGYGDGLNLYAYVKGDPVNRVDPSGLDDVEGPEVVVCGGVQFGARCLSRAQFEQILGSFTGPSGGFPSFSGGGGGGFGGFVPPPLVPPVTASPPQDDQDDQPPCIKPTDGPASFTGGGLDIVPGAGGGFGVYRFSISSIGATGWVASGAFLGGLGGSAGLTKGWVNNFGNFTGFGYRADIPSGISAVGGEAIFGSNGNLAGGAGTLAAGGGIYGGKTKTRVLSSSIPVCPAKR